MPYPYDIDSINRQATENPVKFAGECEAVFNRKVEEAAASITERALATGDHVVFLSGPSGSGKTTTAKRICSALEGIGVHAHTVSMDQYYLSPKREDAPRTENGEIDLESPLCLDLELLNNHFHSLNKGEEVLVPHFSFKLQDRDPEKAMPLRLKDEDIVIYEGIHALNDMLTEEHPNAFKLYISARSDVVRDGTVIFKRTWTRILRRAVRDSLFRGTGALETLKMWATVRRGEKEYISPYKYKADLLFDSSMAYEIPIMKQFAIKAIYKVPDEIERYEELSEILRILYEIKDINPECVPHYSVLREFIGGGSYKY